jgi:hypothetical protein
VSSPDHRRHSCTQDAPGAAEADQLSSSARQPRLEATPRIGHYSTSKHGLAGLANALTLVPVIGSCYLFHSSRDVVYGIGRTIRSKPGPQAFRANSLVRLALRRAVEALVAGHLDTPMQPIGDHLGRWWQSLLVRQPK